MYYRTNCLLSLVVLSACSAPSKFTVYYSGDKPTTVVENFRIKIHRYEIAGYGETRYVRMDELGRPGGLTATHIHRLLRRVSGDYEDSIPILMVSGKIIDEIGANSFSAGISWTIGFAVSRELADVPSGVMVHELIHNRGLIFYQTDSHGHCPRRHCIFYRADLGQLTLCTNCREALRND